MKSKKVDQLPILYIKCNGKIRYWKIWIEEDLNGKYYVCREYGIIGGKITKPERKLKASLSKARTEIEQLWRKKRESGFAEEKHKTKTKNMVIKPMGAHKLDDYGHKIVYPAYLQKKLDGFRCLSHITVDGDVIMQSKGMKDFVFLHHIKREISKITELSGGNIYLDGELYEFGLNLREISSSVMKKYATAEQEKNMEKISYYIFDIFDLNDKEMPFKERYKKLLNIFKKHSFKYLKIVDAVVVNDIDEINSLNVKYIYEGYEGVIVRNMDGIYKFNAKSYDVLRTKEFKKKKFEVTGAKAGTGTQSGAIIWSLKCLKSNETFSAIPVGTISKRREIYKKYMKNKDKYIGKMATVKYLEMTPNGCICRNPIVESID